MPSILGDSSFMQFYFLQQNLFENLGSAFSKCVETFWTGVFKLEGVANLKVKLFCIFTRSTLQNFQRTFHNLLMKPNLSKLVQNFRIISVKTKIKKVLKSSKRMVCQQNGGGLSRTRKLSTKRMSKNSTSNLPYFRRQPISDTISLKYSTVIGSGRKEGKIDLEIDQQILYI